MKLMFDLELQPDSILLTQKIVMVMSIYFTVPLLVLVKKHYELLLERYC